jgi:type II secretory pathway pseudopilin PulG
MHHKRSRSTLFLIEQLIVIAVFAICAAACARILTSAYFSAKDARDLSNAILAAESSAEIFKASYGDFGKVAELMGGVSGVVDGSAVAVVYFDDSWHVCAVDEAYYQLVLICGAGTAPLLSGDLSVENLLTGEEILAFTVYVRAGT